LTSLPVLGHVHLLPIGTYGMVRNRLPRQPGGP
jgi:hypothetical protein